MKEINFFLREMTHLRYFIPLVLEGNARGMKSIFYVVPSNKYNCPLLHEISLKSACEQLNVEIREGRKIVDAEGIIITSEESGIDIIKKNTKAKKVTLCYQTDYTLSYQKYIDIVDHVVMPSENVAKFYDLVSEKNLFTGIPKYDVRLDVETVIKKYSLDPNKKKVLFMWPKSRDLHKMPIDIIKNFNELGWQVIVKTRGKDTLHNNTIKDLLDNGNKVFSDASWYPHSTQELLEVCDLVVNSGSTTIEECVMHEVPLINFDIKPEVRHGRKSKHRVTYDFLYDYDFCLNLKGLDRSFNTGKLEEMITLLVDSDHTDSFRKCKREWLYDHKNSCKNLLDVLTS